MRSHCIHSGRVYLPASSQTEFFNGIGRLQSVAGGSFRERSVGPASLHSR